MELEKEFSRSSADAFLARAFPRSLLASATAIFSILLLPALDLSELSHGCFFFLVATESAVRLADMTNRFQDYFQNHANDRPPQRKLLLQSVCLSKVGRKFH